MDEQARAPQSVLIIDDDRTLLETLVNAIQDLTQMRVLSAESALVGLEIIMREQPSCVVVDITLAPKGSNEMDGFQVVQLIRGDPATAATPIVFLTSRAEDISRFAGLAVGGDNYLVKPVPMKILIGAIERAIATSASERILRLQRLAEGEPPRSTRD